MSRRRLSQLLQTPRATIWDCNVVGVDAGGLYMWNSASASVEIHQHLAPDAKIYIGDLSSSTPIAEIPNPYADTAILDMCHGRQTIYMSNSAIYTSEINQEEETGSQLVSRCDFGPMPLGAVVYHPYRKTYLAHVNSREFIEIDESNFWWLRVIGHREVDTLSIVPSEYSSNIYAAWSHFADVGLDIIRDSGRPLNIVTDFGSPPAILMRPGYPDVLTMLRGYSICTIDMWHAGSACQRRICDTMIAAFGVHVDSNLLIVGEGRYLTAIDYRCGLARVQRLMGGITKLWLGTQQVFAKGLSCLFVFDI